MTLLAPPTLPSPSTPDPASRLKRLPQLRYMGSKYRLLPWLHEVFQRLDFDSALDAFAGSGAVAYLLKAMGKEVISSDFLSFSHELAKATVENARTTLSSADVEAVCAPEPQRTRFIEQTFQGVFFTPKDLVFLDTVWSHLRRMRQPHKKALILASLTRACVKRQPRGVFTVAGDPERYKDGRRDLHMSLEEHFREGAEAYNAVVFDNGKQNRAIRSDVFEIPDFEPDLVYLDPPYVPRADDNCYIKRYHFLEGLSTYWRNAEFAPNSRVHKLKKRFTPFSYRRTADEAFASLFEKFSRSTLVLSYSSNGYPDLSVLVASMRRVKHKVEVFERSHRYHFGTHAGVQRSAVTEYLIVGK